MSEDGHSPRVLGEGGDEGTLIRLSHCGDRPLYGHDLENLLFGKQSECL